MFVSRLRTMIDSQFKSRRAFVRAVTPGAKDNNAPENRAQAYLGQVLRGRKPPPLQLVPIWAETLGLRGLDAERFWDLAAIDHLPIEARPRFLQLISRARSDPPAAAESDEALIRAAEQALRDADTALDPAPKPRPRRRKHG